MSSIFRLFGQRLLQSKYNKYNTLIKQNYENICIATNPLSVQSQIKEEYFDNLYKDKAFRQILDDINKVLSSKAPTEESLFGIEEYEEDKPYARKSPEAIFGTKRIGWVVLPDWLNEAVLEIVKEHDKEMIRHDAKRIYLSLRSTTGYKSVIDFKDPIMGPCKSARNTFKRFSLENEIKPHVLEYGARETMAYIAGYLPISYGPIFNVLNELKRRIPDFSPQNVMDFGTGPGTAIWATHNIWDKHVPNFLGVDISESMLRTAEKILSFQPREDRIKNIEFKRYLTHEPQQLKHDLVISAFTLNELPNDNIRETILESLWDRTKDLLVLIENGTPAGFKIIAEARKRILNINKQQSNEVESITDNLEDETKNSIEYGAHVVAPCPHDGTCPLLKSRNWCHFSQRINRPSYLMQTKNVKNDNFEDSKYCYVILRKGQRPKLPTEVTDKSFLNVDNKRDLTVDAYNWSRLVMPPLKRSGHVVLDYCSKTGKITCRYIERGIIPKSQGKVPYRDAFKSTWGDLFPHEPKKPAVRRHISQSIEQSDVKSKEKDRMRIPSGQQSSKKNNRSLRRKRRHEKEKREDNIYLSDSHHLETVGFFPYNNKIL
ncbi:mitochondrial small ribosomal subunit Rsm22-domain-containing protein [Glomus cerebriforme]|uniref:Mitochondrial small ribosomal subunit Rsm22-domain-containing protein n=1 Tax=Glomus cerebriforme TaxID=658196 RepID=A0A397T066_9GLOM|nr:mitochondrial small ribosomal subunit Rsm22-domain-containing protein [Glomus cerebriforme]